MVIFNSYVSHYQRVNKATSLIITMFPIVKSCQMETAAGPPQGTSGTPPPTLTHASSVWSSCQMAFGKVCGRVQPPLLLKCLVVVMCDLSPDSGKKCVYMVDTGIPIGSNVLYSPSATFVVSDPSTITNGTHHVRKFCLKQGLSSHLWSTGWRH